MAYMILFLTDLIMRYFDDIQFVNAEEVPACPISIDRFPPGTYSFELVAGGAISYQVDDGPVHALHAPALHWHSPTHRYRYGPTSHPWHHLFVVAIGTRAQRMHEEGMDTLSPDGCYKLESMERILPAMRRVIHLVQHGDTRHHAERVAALESLLAIITNEKRTHSLACGWDTQRFESLVESIQHAPFEALSADEQALDMHLSTSHFRKRFRMHTGTAYHAFVLRCRMEQAALWLRDDEQQIQEIAWKAGYDDPAQFSRVFHQHMGLTPRQFRQSFI